MALRKGVLSTRFEARYKRSRFIVGRGKGDRNWSCGQNGTAVLIRKYLRFTEFGETNLAQRFVNARHLQLYDYGIMTMVIGGAMKTMAAGTFKANCLAVMDEVKAKRETVVITKHGKPVAKLVPITKDTDEIYNFLEGKGAVVGDVVSPAIPLDEWGELK